MGAAVEEEVEDALDDAEAEEEAEDALEADEEDELPGTPLTVLAVCWVLLSSHVTVPAPDA